jgi:hypothetical protein
MTAVDFIRAGCASGNYVARRDVLNFVERKFQKGFTSSWIRSFLARNDKVVCTTKDCIVNISKGKGDCQGEINNLYEVMNQYRK